MISADTLISILEVRKGGSKNCDLHSSRFFCYVNDQMPHWEAGQFYFQPENSSIDYSNRMSELQGSRRCPSFFDKEQTECSSLQKSPMVRPLWIYPLSKDYKQNGLCVNTVKAFCQSSLHVRRVHHCPLLDFCGMVPRFSISGQEEMSWNEQKRLWFAGICPTLVFLAERRAAACLFALCCDQYVSKRPGDFNESAEPRTTGLDQS